MAEVAREEGVQWIEARRHSPTVKEASIHRARALGRGLGVLELDKDASDLLRGRGRAIGIDCANSVDAQQIAPSRAFVPCLHARRVHLLHVAGIGGTQHAHEQHTARVALASRPPLGVGLGGDRIHVCLERVRALVGLDRRVDTVQSSAALPGACVAAPIGEDDAQICTSWR